MRAAVANTVFVSAAAAPFAEKLLDIPRFESIRRNVRIMKDRDESLLPFEEEEELCCCLRRTPLRSPRFTVLTVDTRTAISSHSVPRCLCLPSTISIAVSAEQSFEDNPSRFNNVETLSASSSKTRA